MKKLLIDLLRPSSPKERFDTCIVTDWFLLIISYKKKYLNLCLWITYIICPYKDAKSLFPVQKAALQQELDFWNLLTDLCKLIDC